MASIPASAIAEVKAPSQGPSIDSGRSRRATLARVIKRPELTERSQQSSTSSGIGIIALSSLIDMTDSLQGTITPSLRHVQQNPIRGTGRQPLTNITPPRQIAVTPSVTSRSQPLASPTSMPIVQREHSITPPCGPSPSWPLLTCQPYAVNDVTTFVAGSEKRVIKIGIETEFEVAACQNDDRRAMLTNFVKNLATNHNTFVHKRHHRMQTFVRRYNYRGVYNKWCMVEDPSISGSKCEPCKSSV